MQIATISFVNFFISWFDTLSVLDDILLILSASLFHFVLKLFNGNLTISVNQRYNTDWNVACKIL